MKYYLTVPVFLLVMIACENPITFVWDVEISSDSESYNFTDTAAITLTNRSEQVVDIRMCGDAPYFIIQRRVTPVDWVTVYMTDCPGDAQFESVPLQQSIISAIELSRIEEDEQESGIYRVEFILYPEDDRRLRLPVSLRVSNEFTITAPDEGDNNI